MRRKNNMDMGTSYLALTAAIVGLVASIMKLKGTIERGKAEKALHELRLKQMKEQEERAAMEAAAIEARAEAKIAAINRASVKRRAAILAEHEAKMAQFNRICDEMRAKDEEELSKLMKELDWKTKRAKKEES